MNDFKLELANLLEKYNVNIVSKQMDHKYQKSRIAFQQGNIDLFPNLKRMHISAYDLRLEAGMSSLEAYTLYELNKQIKEKLNNEN